MHRRLVLAATTAVAVLGLSASAVLAYPPYHDSWGGEFDDTVPAGVLCAFEVQVHEVVTGDYTVFFDSTGGYAVKFLEEDVAQDTFSANGKTLVGEPFRYNGISTLDADGNITSSVALGGIERVPLPDGKVFWSAGRSDWLAHDFAITMTPDVGHSGDVDAFCAALS